MKIKTDKTSATVTRTVALSDGPVLKVPYSRQGKSFQALKVDITYTLDGHEWVVANAIDVVVSGPVLKKDGSPSLNNVKHRMPTRLELDRGAEDWPWLDEIIDMIRPSGAPVLPEYWWAEVAP